MNIGWLAAAAIIISAQVVLRSAMPATTPRRRRPRDRRRPAPAPPISGAAEGLLEHIPFIEPVKGAKRFRVGANLIVAVTLASAALGVLLYLTGRMVTLWAQTLAK